VPETELQANQYLFVRVMITDITHVAVLVEADAEALEWYVDKLGFAV
jgi:hypothetical protein